MAEKYKPRYNDLSEISDSMTISGKTARECVSIEEAAQKAVAENPEWLLARRLNEGKDSRLELETLGFKILGESNDLFYKVQAPLGWNKSTEGLWTKVIDVDGRERISQFYKGAFYDRDAFLNVYKQKKKSLET